MFWCGCCSPNDTEDGQFLVPSEGPIDNRESIGTTDQNYENERSSATYGGTVVDRRLKSLSQRSIKVSN